MLKSWLALDFGAGSGRAVIGVLEKSRLELREIHRFPNRPILFKGALRWDLLALWDNLLDALKKCARAESGPLRSIGIDTWNLDFGLLDSEDELLYNPICYRSPVRPEVMDRIRSLIDEETLYGLTGISYQPVTGLARLLQHRLDHPKLLFEHARCYLPLPDLLRFLLTGKKNIEDSVSWGTQLVDVRTRQLSKKLLELFEIPPDIFPARIPPAKMVSETLPEIDAVTGIGSVPVATVAGHDTISALVPAAALGDESALLCTGMWFVLGKLLRAPVTDPEALGRGFMNEIAIDGLTYLAKNMMGFYLLEGLVSAWKMSYEEMVEKARQARQFGLAINVNDPSFYSTTDAPGSIEAYIRRTGQAMPDGPGPIVRALFEGYALACRDAFLDLERLSGERIGQIVLVGGAARNPLLCQMIADAVGRSVVAGPAESTSVGNIGMQMIARGDIDSLAGFREIIKRSFATPVFEPREAGKWLTKKINYDHN
jgi:rhamnulokinase